MKHLRFVVRWARRAILAVLILVGALVGLVASLVIGGMGLALMGTAIGIGPVGWAGLGVLGALAGYGAFVAIRNTIRGIRK